MIASSILHAFWLLMVTAPLLLVQGQACGISGNLLNASICSSISSSAIIRSSAPPYSMYSFSGVSNLLSSSSGVMRIPLTSLASSSSCIFTATYSTGSAASSSTGIGLGIYWGTSSSVFPNTIGYNYDQVFSSKSLTFGFTGTTSSLMYLAIVMFNNPSYSTLNNIAVVCGNTVSTYSTCQPGSYSLSSSCYSCPIGRYNPFATNAPACLSCGPSFTTTSTGSISYTACTSPIASMVTTAFYSLLRVLIILVMSVALLVTLCCSCCCLCCLSPKSHSPFTQTITYRYERRWRANIAVWFGIATAIGACCTAFTSPLFRSTACTTISSTPVSSACFISDYYHDHEVVWLDTSSASSSSPSYSTATSSYSYSDLGATACKEGGQTLVALMSLSLCCLVVVSLLSFIRFFYWSVPFISVQTAVKFEWPVLLSGTAFHVIGTIEWGLTCERFVSNNLTSDSFMLPSGHIYLIIADIMLLTACWLDFMIRQSKEWQCKDIKLICPNLPAATATVVVPAVAMPLYQPPQQYQQLQHSAPVAATPQYMMYAPQPAYPQLQYGQPMQPQPTFSPSHLVHSQMLMQQQHHLQHQHQHQHQHQQLQLQLQQQRHEQQQQLPPQYQTVTYATLSGEQWQQAAAARPSQQSTITATAPLLSSRDSLASAASSAAESTLAWSTSSAVLGEAGAAYAAAPSAPDCVQGER